MKALALAFGLLFGMTAQPQPWPNKPIRVVVPSPPGGPPDLIIRMLIPKMSFGQPLVVENRAGAGGIVPASNIPAEVMKSMTGTDIVAVPYKGVAEVMTDLISGRLDLFFVGTQIAASQVQAGKVRALAVTGAKRWKGLPEVPTMQEAGVKDYNLINWVGPWLPAGASAEMLARIHAEIVTALADPEIGRQFDAQGLEAIGMPPEEFARIV